MMTDAPKKFSENSCAALKSTRALRPETPCYERVYMSCFTWVRRDNAWALHRIPVSTATADDWGRVAPLASRYGSRRPRRAAPGAKQLLGESSQPACHVVSERSASSRSLLIPSNNRDLTNGSDSSSTSAISTRERSST